MYSVKKFCLVILLLLLNGITAGCGAGGVGTSVTTGGGSDTTPPVISNPLPTGQQPAGTTSVVMRVTTNENATCKYSVSDSAYASLPNTFTTTGGTTHSQTITGLANGGSYSYYVRCQDTSLNANTTGTHITWNVAALGTGTATLTWKAPTTDANGNAPVVIDGYRVYSCTTTIGTCTNYALKTTVNATSYTDPGLSSGTYCYAVTAYNSGGESGHATGCSGSSCCKTIP
jgi:hypothetical protein